MCENVEKGEVSYISGGSIKWYNFEKLVPINLPSDPAISLLHTGWGKS